MDREKIHSRIREARERAGMNQKQLAEVLHISTQSISAFERNKFPSLDNLRRIAETLGVSTDWLLGMDKPKATNYASLLSLLDELANALGTRIETSGYYEDQNDNIFYTIEYKCCASDHIPLFDALDKIQTMRALLYNGTIKQDIYDTWLKQTISDLENTPIKRKR